MITKTVIKDYVSKKCPYLVSMELNDNSLIELFKNYSNLKEEYINLVNEEKEEAREGSNIEEEEAIFDLNALMQDYPHLRKEIKKIQRNTKKNAVEELVEKYVDNQLISKLSRQYIEQLYGKENYRRCDVDSSDKQYYEQYPINALTQEALKDKKVKVIFEGQIEYEDLRARFDILIRNDDDTFTLVEVKGTNDVFAHPSKNDEPNYDVDTGIKEKYLYDLLFQYYIYKKAGLKISKLGYMYTNRSYQLRDLTYPVSSKELNELFIVKYFINLPDDNTMPLKEYFDTNEYIYNKKKEPVRQSIESVLHDIREIEKEASIKPKKRYECRKGPVCPFIDMCFKGALEPNSIFKLTNWGSFGGDYRRMRHAINDGIYQISDVTPELYGYKETTEERRCNAFTQIMMQKGKIKEKYLIDMHRIEEIIKKDYLNDDIDYLLFFDFESFQFPIPLVKNLTPWKQVVSQYSMHIVKKGYDLFKHDFEKGRGGQISHYEYIADPDVTGFDNPSIPLYETLKSQLIEAGLDPYASNYRVVVFNKNFENTRMREFGEDFAGIADQELIRFVENFRSNIVDLLDFVTSGGMYCIEFNGRGSLKVVQPTLADDENVKEFYKNLPFSLDYSLDYHKGDKCLVYNGAICLDLYKALLVRSHLGESNQGLSNKDLLAEALAYCKIDSWGTVIIYDVIKNVYLGNLKLDALIK